ncbi:MAG: hypothetical protein ACREL7_17465 [Longimicrobiales bacterium]
MGLKIEVSMIRPAPMLPALVLVLAAARCTPSTASRSDAADAASPALSSTEFATLVEQLSEPGGYFPSDNLVSNETSYLHVLGTIASMGVRGGAYLGVGPDQNFSYIAAIRPELAFMIDIRRDNLLHHLLMKALFENSRNRTEYLCQFLGVPLPRDVERWNDATLAEIVTYVDSVAPDRESFERAAEKVRDSVTTFGLKLSSDDLATIRAIHTAFYRDGLDIRYSNRGRFSPFPTWRQLLFQTDLDGRMRNYLASEDDFRFVKAMEARNRIIPVVGDLAGPHALGAIGREIGARGLRVSVFYVSNVEQYLFQGAGFERFAETVAGMPFDQKSVLIRSFFRGLHPYNVPGHMSTQLVEPIELFAAERRNGGYHSYFEVVSKNIIPPRDTVARRMRFPGDRAIRLPRRSRTPAR